MPTADINGQAVGAIGVDIFDAGLSNPAGVIFNTGADFWNRGITEKYLQASDTDNFCIETTDDYRDVEVQLWGRIFIIYMRVDANGRGYKFELSEESDGLTVQLVEDVAEGTWGAAGAATGLGSTSLIGLGAYDHADANGRMYTFGLSGLDIYLKINGTEVWRFQHWSHVKPGKIKMHPHPDYGVTDFIVTALTPATLFSDPDNEIFDPRDFTPPLKNSSTTGTMSASSTSLVVASATGFEIDDKVIVEIGGEAGAGALGTRGVGGQWPTLTYADNTARDADTSQADQTWCWVVATGLTSWWNDGASAWQRSTSAPVGDRYYSKAIPYALCATITNVVGTTITLDTAASVATTNANVYIDNADALNWMGPVIGGAADIMVPAKKLSIPAGNYAMQGVWEWWGGRTDWEVYGAGMNDTTIFTPDGTLGFQMFVYQCDGFKVHDFEGVGNAGDDGYQLYGSTTVSLPQVGTFGFAAVYWPQALEFGLSADNHAYNLRLRDVWMSAVGSSATTGLRVWDCEAILSEAPLHYLSQWYFICADSIDSEFTNCFVHSVDRQSAGFECFRCDGAIFTNCEGINVLFSNNSSGNFLFDRCKATMEPLIELRWTTHYDEDVVAGIASQNPIMQANSNIQPPDANMEQGGSFRNCTVIVEGPANEDGDGWSACIVINGDNPNISVTADPPWDCRGCAAALEDGYFYMPSGGGLASGNLAVISDAEGTSIYGIRADGDARAIFGLINSDFTTPVSRCVFEDPVLIGLIVESENLTLAEWETLKCGWSITKVGSVLHTHVIGSPKIVGY